MLVDRPANGAVGCGKCPLANANAVGVRREGICGMDGGGVLALADNRLSVATGGFDGVT
jgi:hypothetical protein